MSRWVLAYLIFGAVVSTNMAVARRAACPEEQPEMIGPLVAVIGWPIAPVLDLLQVPARFTCRPGPPLLKSKEP